MRIVCISDTHGMHERIDVPDGDVLVHAGDLTAHGSRAEVSEFVDWLGEQPHKHKVFTPGNHDRSLESWEPELPDGVHYLKDQAVTLDGVKFYGSPWTPQFFNWAFMRPRGRMSDAWGRIPKDTDVLVTHGPPYGHGDLVPRGWHVGCFELLQRLPELAQLKVHIFGHIHEGYGVTRSEHMLATFVNAAICTGDYKPTNPPIVVSM